MPASALPDDAPLRLTRRDALKTFTLITGGTLVALAYSPLLQARPVKQVNGWLLHEDDR
ncbi:MULTISPECIES: hypothetical protein [unclassified Halomonas]|uniref:hypothetical protein n=1 Tax=unclassified Halomonas TaxID=2609666 RepID=UPI0016432C0C|nr:MULTISPECIES: hypothetical protein [unclassified Halomonas]UDM08122.1 hypothetical protein LG409_04235 [Halomonas sp. NyZ770]